MPLRHSVEGDVRDGRQFHGHRSLRACGVVQYDRTAAISSVVHSSAADRAAVAAGRADLLLIRRSGPGEISWLVECEGQGAVVSAAGIALPASRTGRFDSLR